MKAIHNTTTLQAIHNAAMMHASEAQSVLAIMAAMHINQFGRYDARKQVANLTADPRLVRLARQLAAATRAGV